VPHKSSRKSCQNAILTAKLRIPIFHEGNFACTISSSQISAPNLENSHFYEGNFVFTISKVLQLWQQRKFQRRQPELSS